MTSINHDLHTSVEKLIFDLDNKQFLGAAVEIGRITELAQRLREVASLACDALWQDDKDTV